MSVGSSARSTAECAERARKFLCRHKIEAVVHAVASSAPPAEVILEQVAHVNAGLLVMGAYGQPGLREFFVGSVTQKVLDGSPVPLFLYH